MNGNTDIQKKIEAIANSLGYKIVDDSYNRFILTASGWRYLIIRRNTQKRGQFTITSFLPCHNTEYRSLSFSGKHKSGNFALESRSLFSLINDIKSRILKDYDSAINENLKIIQEMKKTAEKLKSKHSIITNHLLKNGYTGSDLALYSNYLTDKHRVKIDRHLGSENLTYSVEIKSLNPDQLLILSTFIKNL